jgi:hypothetical protein
MLLAMGHLKKLLVAQPRFVGTLNVTPRGRRDRHHSAQIEGTASHLSWILAARVARGPHGAHAVEERYLDIVHCESSDGAENESRKGTKE